jgi:hypothetical protein
MGHLAPIRRRGRAESGGGCRPGSCPVANPGGQDVSGCKREVVRSLLHPRLSASGYGARSDRVVRVTGVLRARAEVHIPQVLAARLPRKRDPERRRFQGQGGRGIRNLDHRRARLRRHRARVSQRLSSSRQQARVRRRRRQCQGVRLPYARLGVHSGWSLTRCSGAGSLLRPRQESLRVATRQHGHLERFRFRACRDEPRTIAARLPRRSRGCPGRLSVRAYAPRRGVHGDASCELEDRPERVPGGLPRRDRAIARSCRRRPTSTAARRASCTSG